MAKPRLLKIDAPPTLRNDRNVGSISTDKLRLFHRMENELMFRKGISGYERGRNSTRGICTFRDSPGWASIVCLHSSLQEPRPHCQSSSGTVTAGIERNPADILSNSS
jgi:hypothetical protein